jgi:pyruvate dehydrogenase E2 component (dihydrolipoamide acetyltransferase)
MGNVVEVKVPDIGDFKDVEIIEVLVSEGDRVEAEDLLITLESDKASMDIPSPQGGIVKGVKLKAGERVSKGTPILDLEVEDASGNGNADAASGAAEESGKGSGDDGGKASGQGDTAESAKPDDAPRRGEQASPPSAAPASAPRQSPTAGMVNEESFRKAHASPAVRRFARELGVDLGRVEGSGRKGRILREDVQGFVKRSLAQGASGGLGVAPAPEVDFSRFGQVETQGLTKINRLTGEYLHRNWVTIPHVTQFDEADITELDGFRRSLVEEYKDKGVKITFLVFLMKAVVSALKEFPRVNASLDVAGENLILKKYYHLGIAVDTPDGLVVPVVRDVDRKSLVELARELAEISEKARKRRLKSQDMEGGCLTITSLGGIGGTHFTPIVNAPEVAILGVSKARMQPVWDGEAFNPRLVLPLSLSYDHRVIDGALGARFTSYLSGLLSDMRRMLL